MPFEPGTEVGCRYRWPYSSAHPDCWQPPYKGIVLKKDDPRAWTATLAFPIDLYPTGPSQEAATIHVNNCLAQGLLGDVIPVLYNDGKFTQWDTVAHLQPYTDEYKAWEEARQEARQNR